ncbi:hypothetical protein GOQ30_05705 [Flavobacterium sp. TP390]|uniref:Uncharacterized protein n=1 Tax=Flavobacterium profundi TaxID=1774945 RepID=A0A6I4IG99_9FLAO|nr:hypothetical protein [Flavobacterium profundi]MVO08658.1 hypothetical protein [Flavobacterium profundi]
MCEKVNEIKFCTCITNGLNTIIHNKKKEEKKNKNKYTWTLYKYVGLTQYPMDGMLIYPEDVLSEALTAEKMVEELNRRNCFDFNYNPNEGDNLQIYNPDKYTRKYLSFIYRGGKWEVDSYNRFTYDIEKINYGKVEFE